MSLVARIYFSMGAIVALILLVGGTASLRTSDLAKTFVDYRETARTSLLAGNLSQSISDIRLSAFKYRFNADPVVLEEISKTIEIASGQATALAESLTGYSGLAELEQLPEALQEYSSLLRQASEQGKRLDALREVTTNSGRAARTDTTDIMETALRNNQTQVVSGVGFAKSNLLLGRLYLERFLFNFDVANYERAASEIEAARSNLEALAQEAADSSTSRALETVIGDLDEFSNAAAELKDTVEQRNRLYSQMDDIGPRSLTLVKKAVDEIEGRQNTLGPLGAETAENSIVIVSTLVILGALMGLVLAFFSGRTISRLLGKVTADMTELAEGNLEIEIEAGTQKHEIGKMTDAMAVFLQNARDARDLNAELADTEKKEQQRIEAEREREAKLEERQLREEAERNADKTRMTMLEDFQRDMETVMGDAASGNFSVRMSDQVDDANLAKLAHLVNGQLQATETNITDIVSSIGELAKGNLAVRIQGERQGVFLAMKEDFNASVAALSDTMSKILQSGDSVSETSVELKNSSKDMSKRAEDNAATVEETSAAVEEITASIRQVVASAKAADQATQRVRQSADETRSVSTETEVSINAMTDASAQINRVVKVIEDIAFQINLLALNAGVEAARAGEAGLGFSVVASEVRALALRSQEAVQEITQVIEQSNLSVEAGAQQVGLSRQALEGIITEVEVASGQISEIASAVEEQAKGIEEVNTALRAIDVNAQKNAATLEVMTVSSVSLSEEAGQLSSALGEFNGLSATSNEKKVKNQHPLMKKQTHLPTKAPKSSPKMAATGSQGAVAVVDDEGWDEF